MTVLSFGSAQMGDGGQVVFNAFLGDGKGAPGGHRQALLLATPTHGVSELAVENEYGPNHTLYQRPFGLPAALPSPLGTIIAFTAKTPSGAALFLYSGGSMARVFPTGTLTPLGPVTYLSPGRPGLMLDGTTAGAGRMRAHAGDFSPDAAASRSAYPARSAHALRHRTRVARRSGSDRVGRDVRRGDRFRRSRKACSSCRDRTSFSRSASRS